MRITSQRSHWIYKLYIRAPSLISSITFVGILLFAVRVPGEALTRLHWTLGLGFAVPIVALLWRYVAHLTTLERPPNTLRRSMDLVAFFGGLVVSSVAVFSVLSLAFFDAGWADYSFSYEELSGGTLADSYFWHVLDVIPGLELWETLDVSNPVQPEGRLAKALAVLFRVSLIGPIIAVARKWTASGNQLAEGSP